MMIPQDTARKYAVINALASLKINTDENSSITKSHLSREELAQLTGIPALSLIRIINMVKLEFNLDINYSQAKRGYCLEGWGVIDRERFSEKFGKIDRRFLFGLTRRDI